MSLKVIAEEIIKVVNSTTNDYDAREAVLEVLKENIEGPIAQLVRAPDS